MEVRFYISSSWVDTRCGGQKRKRKNNQHFALVFILVQTPTSSIKLNDKGEG
jgi:hypothetical protein